jgi:hypothetical protein
MHVLILVIKSGQGATGGIMPACEIEKKVMNDPRAKYKRFLFLFNIKDSLPK